MIPSIIVQIYYIIKFFYWALMAPIGVVAERFPNEVICTCGQKSDKIPF